MLKKANIDKIVLATNSRRDLTNIASQLTNFEIVQPLKHAPKPARAFYRQVIKASSYEPEQIAMVGDRYIQDIAGAKHAGLVTILLNLLPEHTSGLEKLILRHKWQPLVTKFYAKKSVPKVDA
jgi:predicted HAD superfamily phosphohydrolase YqeG